MRYDQYGYREDSPFFEGPPYYDSLGKPTKDQSPRRVKRKPPEKPRNLRELIARMKKDAALNVGMEALKERGREFDDTMTLALTGVAMHGPAREHLDDELDRIWQSAKLPDRTVDEVVIGGGFHAAVYASVRVAAGHPKPLVLERSERVGGTFAVSRGPSFYLNSRNRPGSLGTPGRREALNVLPGGPVQPSMLTGDEYQRNSDLAFAIRTALGLHANVVTGFEAGSRLRSENGYLVYDQAIKRFVQTRRIVYASGLGEPIRPVEHERVLTFDALMRRFDERFPLRGMSRVAVIGAGDSGRTAVEALTGQGPAQGMSAAALDFVERIDWYGLVDAQNKSQWEECNRSRYKGIARSLPRNTGGAARVKPVTDRADQVSGGYDMVTVNGRRYDHAIWCAGYDAPTTLREDETGETVTFADREVARKLGDEVYAVGPAASLPMDVYESSALPSGVPENNVALFRYADRTAALASSLAGPDRG